MGNALVTDFYELNMAASYLRHKMTGTATFSLFCRRLPDSRGFLVATGLEDSLRFLEDFAFDEADLEYLARIGFAEDDLRRFRSLRFTGDVWAVPEGTMVFADEPLLEVTSPIAEAQLVETYLLNQCTFQTAIATKAARCRIAAGGRIDIADFSIRRTHGVEAGNAVARLSAMKLLTTSLMPSSPSPRTSPIRQPCLLTPTTQWPVSRTRSRPFEPSDSRIVPPYGSTAVTLRTSLAKPASASTPRASTRCGSSCPVASTNMISPDSSPRVCRSMP